MNFKRPWSVHPIQDLWFKPRTIFQINRGEYERRAPEHDEYQVDQYDGQRSLSDLEGEDSEFLRQHIRGKKLQNRLKKEDCVLFLARNRESGEPVGFYWSIVARSKAVWHDNYQVLPGTALVFNAYVAEEHRRQGIYRLLQGISHDYLFTHTDCEAITTIVENKNTASMKANRQFGLRAEKRNYLLKFLSVNVLSIIVGEMINIYFVLHRNGL